MYKRWMVAIAAISGLGIGSCSNNPAVIAPNVFAQYLAALVGNLDDINTLTSSSFNVPEELQALLDDPSGDTLPESLRGPIIINPNNWSFAFVEGDIDSGGEEFYGFVGLGFRDTNETLEAFLFYINSIPGNGTTSIIRAVYIDDLLASDLTTHIWPGDGTVNVTEASVRTYVLNECDYGSGASRGGGPYRGLWTRSLKINVAMGIDLPPSSEATRGHDAYLYLPAENTDSDTLTVPGLYLYGTSCAPE